MPVRLARYELTNDWNVLINRRQFGWLPADRGMGIGGGSGRFLPADVVAPDVTYRDELTVDAAGTAIRLIHARGETDDHTWAWLPEQRVGVRRRPVHLELPERRQPAEGAALPGGLGRARCARSSTTSRS